MQSRTSIHPKAFTLLEMVIVMGIIAVLAGGVISLMGNFGEGAKIQSAENGIRTIDSSIKQYEITGKTLPSTAQGIKALVEKPTTDPIPKRWTQVMKEVPKDPWGNEYVYENVSGKVTIRSSGPDGIDKTEDDISSDD